jgi:hypothetical protein
LAELPDPVVALAAVPGLGARPSWRRPVTVGCHATGGGPIPPRAGIVGRVRGDQRTGRAADSLLITGCGTLNGMGAAHVPLPVILSYLCVAVGRNRTTAGCVALDWSVLAGNGRAPQTGTAVKVPTGSRIGPALPPGEFGDQGETVVS